ncbi:hypothetical protein LguiB_035488 [Lonicera macranthoides]
MGDLRETNVAVTEERPVSPSPPSPSNPSPSLIGAERWAKAEQATRKIIYQVQPTDVSEERRRKVIEYVQRLITGCLGCEPINTSAVFGYVLAVGFRQEILVILETRNCCGTFAGSCYGDSLVEDMRIMFALELRRTLGFECYCQERPGLEHLGEGDWGWGGARTLALIQIYDSHGYSTAWAKGQIRLKLMTRKVFPYGSVPLKTYLPDGDIDLTAFGGANVEDALASDMVSVLEGEDKNRGAEFIVKDVQLIRAEVKLVKCIVQNIAVDISLNQIGGLCTLCFLEQVDRFIGKDHLFKCSIILIKAWCYYESRILGAHHGLISTYALETLVLYIFHLFHSTLDGPLAVLYKFLDYFSKFDWDNYCVSLTGPVRMSSLPEIIAEMPENGGGDLLLTNDFLRYCVDTFSVPSKGVDTSSRTFAPKHLNIVDPLKENNNLGRSVSKGNFYRIRSAFTYGARKLGRILIQPEDNIAAELCNFFSNTLDRHGGGQRPDVQDPVPISNRIGFGLAFSDSETESNQEERVVYDSKFANCNSTGGDFKHNHDESLQDGVNNITALGPEMKLGRIANGQHIFAKAFYPTTISESNCAAKGTALLGSRLSGDAEDLATSRIQGLKISNSSPKVSVPVGEGSVPPVGIARHAPHLYFSKPVLSNGMIKDGNLDTKQSENYEHEEVSSGQVIISCDQDKKLMVNNGEVLTTIGLNDVVSAPNSFALPEELNHVTSDWASASSAGSLESMSSLSDLTGDYDSHLNCLQIGRWCYEYASSVPALPMPPPLASHVQSMNSWDPIHHTSQYKRNGFSHGGLNGVIPNPVFYPMNPLLIPGVAFGLEEMPKPRGTGTYFPNMNRPPQGYRPSSVKGRNNHATSRSPRNNGRALTFVEFPIEQGGPSDIHQSRSPRRKVYPTANGITNQSEGVEYGAVGPVPVGMVPLVEGGQSARQPRPASSLQQTNNNTQGLPPPPGMQRPKPVLGIDQDRFMMKSSYHLKDEEDFPPLSVSDCNGK